MKRRRRGCQNIGSGKPCGRVSEFIYKDRFPICVVCALSDFIQFDDEDAIITLGSSEHVTILRELAKPRVTPG